MNSINRFFSAKKTPASQKAGAAKKAQVQASELKENSPGKAALASDQMEQPSQKEHKEQAPMPRSALKKAKPVALKDAAPAVAQAARKRALTPQEANRSFDAHYGGKTSREGGAAKYTFAEDPVKERIAFERYANEMPHIRGDVEKLHNLALKRQEPVFFIAEQGRVMVWPSGHTYHGAFEREGLKPGPKGQLTLPSGETVTAFFKNGACYRAEDADGHTIEPNVAQVHKFYTPRKLE